MGICMNERDGRHGIIFGKGRSLSRGRSFTIKTMSQWKEELRNHYQKTKFMKFQERWLFTARDGLGSVPYVLPGS